MVNYYQLLNIGKDISPDELNESFACFKQKLSSYSPSIVISEDELRLRQPEIWNAYEFLLNPISRKEYDESLERDRIHQLYEAQNKIVAERNLETSNRWKYAGLGATILLVVVYFLQQQISSNTAPEEPKWRTHNITDEVKIQLPADIDSIGNFLPINFAKRTIGYVSELSGGFSVTVGWLEMYEGYSLSFRDVGYIGSREMHNMHRRFETHDTVKLNIAIHNYNTQLITGTYQIDNVIRAYENYTLIRGNQVIKVIINYIPDKIEHEKYCKRIFNSLTCY